MLFYFGETDNEVQEGRDMVHTATTLQALHLASNAPASAGSSTSNSVNRDRMATNVSNARIKVKIVQFFSVF